MKKTIIIVVIILALLASGSFYYFIGTPTYSLYKLKKAVQNHDSAKFNKYVDVDRVVENLFETASAQMEKEIGDSKDNPLGEFGIDLAKGLLSTFKEGMKNEINKSIEEISEGKDNKFVIVKIKEVRKEGKAAKVTLESPDGQAMKINMTQMPGRYWRVVGMDFEDFAKMNPNTVNPEDGETGDKKGEPQQIIEKNVGEDVELATLKIKINSVAEKQAISDSFGDSTNSSEGSKFIVLNTTVTNITNEGFDFDSNGIKVTDDQGRKFDPFDDTIGGIKNYLEMRDLQPSISETGMMVYQVPSDAESYSMDIGKKDTNEIYRIRLK